MESLTLARATAAMCACVLFVATLAAAEDMNGPPARPGVFRNAQELRDYLKALNEYFAIVGRPRFGRSGKRSSLATLLRRFGSPVMREYGLDGNGPLVSPSELEYPITYST